MHYSGYFDFRKHSPALGSQLIAATRHTHSTTHGQTSSFFMQLSVWAMLLELRIAKIAKSEAFTSLVIVDDLHDAVDSQAYSSDREHKRHDLPAQLHVKLQLPRKMGLPE
jgi:hypothetical protein